MPTSPRLSSWFRSKRLEARSAGPAWFDASWVSCAVACCAAIGCTGEVSGDVPYDCSLEGRKAFVANLMTDYYLWYDRVPPVDTSAMSSPEEVMRAMMFTELDQWSGMQQRAERSAFFDQGRFQGLGYTLGVDPAGGLRISWVHAGSAAGRAGLDRGAQILAVNGRAVETLSPGDLNFELTRDVVLHNVRELDGVVHDVELRQGDVDITSVKDTTLLDTPAGPVGYLMFTTFVRPGEAELAAAFSLFRERGISRLVIDLRYNGGGLLSTAALLGSLIAADASGQPLIVETYNDRHATLNRERLLFDVPESVNATDVVFLVTGRTASASEQVINGLAPYLNVSVVGTRTLGKPVGADSWDHCDYTLAPITFHSLNVAGAGDYFQGIEPACNVEDDLLHRLGDPEEAQLAAALRLLDGQSCEVEKSAVAAPAHAPQLPSKLPALPGWY
jgi:carboxyl-terminal processing protease